MRRYLDYNATCLPVEKALDAWLEVARDAPGNASSMHWAGRAARRILDDSRESLASHIGADAGSIVFTSGGTEANNLAIYGHLSRQQPGRILVSAIEHPSVLQPCERWKELGMQLDYVRPGSDGVVDVGAFESRLTEDTRLVSLMAANNETGAVQPVQKLCEVCRERDITVLVDAVQALGKLPVNVGEWGADFVSFSAHKIGGPKGVGALVVRRGMQVQELTPGGGQERRRRSGTENIPGIAGFTAALGEIDFQSFGPLRDSFERELCETFEDVSVFCREVDRLPNTSMFCVPGMDSETLLMQLDLAGFAVASGSACSSGKHESSHVLAAMGCSEDAARGSVRVSFGPGNTEADVSALIEELARIRSRLQNMAGADLG